MIINTKDRQFNVEAIFLDLDGTFFDKLTKKPSKQNIEAIKQIQQQKIPIIISTGRSYSDKVKKWMKILNIQYAICQNGAIVVDKNGNNLLNIKLSNNQVESIVKIVKNNRLGFIINSQFVIYSNHWIWAPLRLLWFRKWKKISKFNIRNNIVNKVVILGLLSSKKNWLVSNNISKNVDDISAKTSGRDKIIEITYKTANKGEGAIFVSNLLGVNIKNTIHIGDSENDTTTINKVGALIAMKDGSKKLLEIATHIGPKHKNSGLAKILKGQIIENKR